MKDVTIIATVPPRNNSEAIKKLMIIKSYLRDEVGVNVNIIVTACEGRPKIIAMGEVVDLGEDLRTIIYKIASRLAYDVGDPYFLDKVAIGSPVEE